MRFIKLKFRAKAETKIQKRFHMPKKVWIPLAVVLVIAGVPVLALGWMGFVPGLSTIMGSTSQRNLDVNFTQQNLASFQQKMPLAIKDDTLAPINPINTEQKELLAQPIQAQNVALSQEDVTATLNSYHWSWIPVNNIQVRLTDGTVEVSGLLNNDHLDAFEQYVANGHSLSPSVANAISWSKHFRNYAPVYLRAKVYVTNNVLSFKLEQAQIGRLDIPLGLAGSTLRQGVYANIKANNLDIQTAYFSDKTLHFGGTYPSVIYVRN
jgi:hypothetical protein